MSKMFLMSTTQSKDRDTAFELYRGEIYTWAYRLVGRHHDALDVVQDVFLRWIQNDDRSTLRNPRAWLRRVTIHRAIDFARSRSADRKRERKSAKSEVGSFTDQTQQDELRADLVAALDKLSDMQRSVLIAKVFDGLTFARIAAEMEIAVSTAKTHYLRALTTMRHRLGNRWEN